MNGADGASQLGMSREQFETLRPRATEFNELVIACWNFAGGWEVERLYIAAGFYGVEDFELLLRLCMVLQVLISARERERLDGQ